MRRFLLLKNCIVNFNSVALFKESMRGRGLSVYQNTFCFDEPLDYRAGKCFEVLGEEGVETLRRFVDGKNEVHVDRVFCL